MSFPSTAITQVGQIFKFKINLPRASSSSIVRDSTSAAHWFKPNVYPNFSHLNLFLSLFHPFFFLFSLVPVGVHRPGAMWRACPPMALCGTWTGAWGLIGRVVKWKSWPRNLFRHHHRPTRPRSCTRRARRPLLAAPKCMTTPTRRRCSTASRRPRSRRRRTVSSSRTRMRPEKAAAAVAVAVWTTWPPPRRLMRRAAAAAPNGGAVVDAWDPNRLHSG